MVIIVPADANDPRFERTFPHYDLGSEFSARILRPDAASTSLLRWRRE
jgi:hypothetical protein